MLASGCRTPESGGDGDSWDSSGGDMGGSLGGNEERNGDRITGSAVTRRTATASCVFRARCPFKVLMLVR